MPLCSRFPATTTGGGKPAWSAMASRRAWQNHRQRIANLGHGRGEGKASTHRTAPWLSAARFKSRSFCFCRYAEVYDTGTAGSARSPLFQPPACNQTLSEDILFAAATPLSLLRQNQGYEYQQGKSINIHDICRSRKCVAPVREGFFLPLRANSPSPCFSGIGQDKPASADFPP